MSRQDDISVADYGNYLSICFSNPPTVNFNGIWSRGVPSITSRYIPLPLLELQILMISFVTMLLHVFFKAFGFPVFVSQVFAGLLLGSSWKTKPKIKLFSVASQDILGMLSVIGYTLYVFLIGVKIDLNLIKRTGKKSLIIGVSSIVIPTILGLMVIYAFTKNGKNHRVVISMGFVLGSQSVTSFAVVSCLLDHLKILNSEPGRLGLSCSLVADLGSLSSAVLVTFLNTASKRNVLNTLMSLGTVLGSAVAVALIFRPAMLWVVRQTPPGRSVKDVYICAIVLLVLISGVTTDLMKQTGFFGPFILGLAVPEGPPLGASLVNKLDGFVTSVFLPLFITITAIKVDLSSISSNPMLLTECVVLLLAITVGKILVCSAWSLCFNMSSNDAFVLGLIMSSKGIVELSVCSFFYDNQLISDQLFAVLIVYILFLSILIPILVKRFYDPLRKYAGHERRNVLNLKPNDDLRILGCLHSQNDAPALMNLLDASCPTEESPIYLYALHLVELVGRATPFFISHQLDDETDSSERSLSSNVIQMLQKYERNNRGVVSVEVFTAIAPMKLMHEDICTLALDKLTSIIILPFHQKWSREGYMESDDNSIRALNCHVLDRAPCSVGILIDHGHIITSHSFGSSQSHSPPFQVAVIFIGGQDDREALSFARLMTKGVSSVLLTVIRLVAEDESNISHWEKILDSEQLKDVKCSFVGGSPVKYEERKADEGSQTAAIVRSIADEYNLVMVGRRYGIESPQTVGLMEWNEFPELGTLGDMLASYEFNSTASVMVIQTHQQCI